MSLREVGDHLDTLNVPFEVLVMSRPTARPGSGVHASIELAIAPEARPALLLWVPSLAAKLARGEARIEAGRNDPQG